MDVFVEPTLAEPCSPDALASVDPFDDPSGQPLARRWFGNLLALDADLLRQVAGQRLIVNSGSLADDLCTLDPRNWMASGESALLAQLDALDPALRSAGVALLIEPHSRHILNDAQVVHNFFRERDDERIGLVLNPTALFEPSMMALAPDHFQRIAEALAPRASVFVLENASLDAAGERLSPCDLNSGVHDLCAVLDACLPLLRPHTPVILRPVGSGPPTVLIESIRARAADSRAV